MYSIELHHSFFDSISIGVFVFNGKRYWGIPEGKKMPQYAQLRCVNFDTKILQQFPSHGKNHFKFQLALFLCGSLKCSKYYFLYGSGVAVGRWSTLCYNFNLHHGKEEHQHGCSRIPHRAQFALNM